MHLLSRAVSLVILAGLSIAIAGKTPITSSRTVTIGSVSYYVPGTPVASFKFPKGVTAHSTFSKLDNPSGLIPFSFITTSSPSFSKTDLANVSATWSKIDDVWSPAFLQGTY